MSDIQQWYYADATGQQYGPATAEQLQQLAATGQITAETQVWTEGLETYVPAAQVEGLIPAAPVAQAAPAHQPQMNLGPSQPTARVNPYAAPQSQVVQANPATADGDYPIPLVKKCSYGLFLSLYLIGIAMIIFGFVKSGMDNSQVQSMDDPYGLSSTPVATNHTGLYIILLGAGIFLAALIYRFIMIYRGWAILQPGGASTTPGKAVGFLFIPLFNLYWLFIAYWKWSVDYSRIIMQYPNLRAAPRVAPGMFLTTCILMIASNLPLLGAFIGIASVIFELIIAKQLCDAINFMVTARMMPQRQQTHPQGGLNLY